MFHYAKLFSNTDGKEHLKKKCVILVDNDKNCANDDYDETAKKLWEKYNHDNIKVLFSEKDFENYIVNILKLKNGYIHGNNEEYNSQKSIIT